MADSSAQAEIRGIDIDKLAKGFADEANVLKKFVNNSTTKARELRYYSKTAGCLDSTDSTGMTASLLVNTSSKARMPVIEQSWTRETSYVKKFMAESPLISLEDIKDSDIDVFATNVRDVVMGVERKVDERIFTILFNCLAATPDQPLTGAVTVQTTAAVDEWDVPATMDPVTDVLGGKQKIRSYGYDPEGSILGMNSIEHKYLIAYLINTKGSSIPAFASQKIESGVVMEFLGCKIVVSEHFTTFWVYQWVPKAATWKSFMPITSAIIDEPGIGKKIRCWEEGELILTDPKAVHVISGTDS